MYIPNLQLHQYIRWVTIHEFAHIKRMPLCINREPRSHERSPESTGQGTSGRSPRLVSFAISSQPNLEETTENILGTRADTSWCCYVSTRTPNVLCGESCPQLETQGYLPWLNGTRVASCSAVSRAQLQLPQWKRRDVFDVHGERTYVASALMLART